MDCLQSQQFHIHTSLNVSTLHVHWVFIGGYTSSAGFQHRTMVVVQQWHCVLCWEGNWHRGSAYWRDCPDSFFMSVFLSRTHKPHQPMSPLSEGRGESTTDTQRRTESGKVEKERKEEEEAEEGVDPVMLKYMELVRQRREQVCICMCACVCVYVCVCVHGYGYVWRCGWVDGWGYVNVYVVLVNDCCHRTTYMERNRSQPIAMEGTMVFPHCPRAQTGGTSL